MAAAEEAVPIVRAALVDQFPVEARGASQSSREIAVESSVAVCPVVVVPVLRAIAVPCLVAVVASTMPSSRVDDEVPTMQVAMAE